MSKTQTSQLNNNKKIREPNSFRVVRIDKDEERESRDISILPVIKRKGKKETKGETTYPMPYNCCCLPV